MGRATVAAALAAVEALGLDDRRRLFRRLRGLGIARTVFVFLSANSHPEEFMQCANTRMHG